VRRALHDPFWIVVIAALVIGLATGAVLAKDEVDATPFFLGHAWLGTPTETRGVLATMFGIQFTVLTLVLYLNAPLVQSAANQYSPRLVPFFLKYAPFRRAVPLFTLSSGYILAAVRELGLMSDEHMGPRPVVSGALLLLLIAFTLLTIDTLRMLRFMRVERVLGLVRSSAFAAADRIRARLERLPRDREASLVLPAGASKLTAFESGYLADVDPIELTRIARKAAVRVRICRTIGEYIDSGEVLGYFFADAAGAVDARVGRALVTALTIGPVREPELDPTYAVRILADVATRALSSNAYDAYTARQALQMIRSVLRRLAALDLADWNMTDRDGRVRASVIDAGRFPYRSVSSVRASSYWR